MSRSVRRATALAALGAAATLSLARPARGADQIPLRVGAIPINPSGQLYFAQAEGIFKDVGLDVTPIAFSNGASTIAAMMSGSLDISGTSPTPLIYAHLRGLPLKLIATAIIYTGPVPNSALMVLQDSNLIRGADFNGKRIAVAGLHDITQYGIEAWIDKGGGDSKTVQFVEIPYAEMAAALQQGRVDATGEIEPFITGSKDVAKVIGNINSAISNRYLVAGWCATTDWLSKNAAAASRYVLAMQRSAQWANGHPKESDSIMQRISKITPEVAATMARPHYDEAGRVDSAIVQPVIDTMVHYGGIMPFPASEVIWTSPASA